jgi:hypothetical protein
MKVDQFKGIASPRKKKYVEGDAGSGLNEWAEADEDIAAEYEDTSLPNLVFLAKLILKEKFETSRNN